MPELDQMESFTDDVFSLSFVVFDGKNTTVSDSVMRREEEYNNLRSLARQVISSYEGAKTTSWTKQDLQYPVYSLTICPNVIGQSNPPGETVVWSGGYLFTSSGDVYECVMDFGPLMEPDLDCLHQIEVNDTELSDLSAFRPLFCANGGWDAEYLTPSEHSDMYTEDYINAEFKELSDRNGYFWATIELSNGGTQNWRYESRTADVEVLVDGTWYVVPRDPRVIAFAGMVVTYNDSLEPGDTQTIGATIGPYGGLPPGEYRLVINGTFEDKQDAYASYVVER
ncbi:MAG: hypothetical protein K6E12_02720 [Saccharofermentans sp.]|nr:hypothetical protein [Saccharofermentans sp.]